MVASICFCDALVSQKWCVYFTESQFLRKFTQFRGHISVHIKALQSYFDHTSPVGLGRIFGIPSCIYVYIYSISIYMLEEVVFNMCKLHTNCHDKHICLKITPNFCIYMNLVETLSGFVTIFIV